MHIASHGRDFKEKAIDELKEMNHDERFVYGLICVASAHRFTLRQDDIGIAYGTDKTEWLQVLNNMERRKLILPHKGNTFRARHRVIAQFVYDSLIEEGRLNAIVQGLIRIGTTKTTISSPRESLHFRLLRKFLNHNIMKRGVGSEQAREIYGEFQNALAWNYHFWLHRGALELETDNLDRAENFLDQAKSISRTDIYIDNEMAYLLFKKAIASPTDADSLTYVDDAIDMLNEVVRQRPDQVGHAYHIMGYQGLAWAKVGIEDTEKKKIFLEHLLSKVEKATNLEPTDMMKQLREALQSEILSMAVTDNGKTSH